MFKFVAILIHIILNTFYVVFIQTDLFVLLSILFHVLTFVTNPQCYVNHCNPYPESKPDSIPLQSPKYNPKSSSLSDEGTPNSSQLQYSDSQHSQQNSPIKTWHLQLNTVLQQCPQCGLTKWIRMHHCYRCKTCVHKYDHHCIMLGICIGENNQKYYILFLWAYIYACVKQMLVYFSYIPQHIWVNKQTGYQHTDYKYDLLAFAIIFYILATTLTTYLALFHTVLAVYNDTTYERKKRYGIWYLRGLNHVQHPFDKGIWINLKYIFLIAGQKPIVWWNPSVYETYQRIDPRN